ncbi:MAG: class I SAM-dependent methyltransferase [Victivallales bacterium]|nr:class I SAM-dependent methyltransferase [Victivallales bacterium]
MPKEIILQKGRERSLLRRHPWIFDGAVAAVSGAPLPGDTVEVYSFEGNWLARASYSPVSKLRARVWTFDQAEPIDQEFFNRRIDAAAAYRSRLALQNVTNAWRLVHGEADGLPGCVIDRYGDFVVCQFLCAGSEAAHEMILAALRRDSSIRGIYERSDTDARERDGLKSRCGLLWGEEPPELFAIRENGISFLADLRTGHKTGFYLDQRDNRASLPFCHGADVLNCFCYTGGFGLRAAYEGAKSVTQVDLSAPALELARQNAELNGFYDSLFTYTKADVFEQLRRFRDMGRQFDVVVLDPPKFAETPKQLEKAARGYKDINLLGAKLTRPGGFLVTFSCSGAMTPELFAKIVGDAARDAGRSARIVRTMGQAPDHPVTLDFPEGRYLTGLQLSLS